MSYFGYVSLREERSIDKVNGIAFGKFLKELCPPEFYNNMDDNELFAFLYKENRFDRYVDPEFQERHGRVFAIRKWIRNNPEKFLGLLEWELL